MVVNKNILFIMAGALAVAIVAAMFVQANLSSKGGKSAPMTEVLVAVKKLSVGSQIKKEDLKWQPWPETAVFKGAIVKSKQKDPEKLEIVGKTVRREVVDGEPVTEAAVIADVKGSGNFMAANLEPGMRAMGVKVSADTGVAGFVSPGDRVDVLVTYQVKLPTSDQPYSAGIVQKNASQVILSNVRVMAVDQIAKEGARDAKVSKTVTVEVTKSQSETLALAAKMGTLSLALRRLGEQAEESDVNNLTTDALLSNVMRKVREAKGQSSSVRLYNGTEVQNIPVR